MTVATVTDFDPEEAARDYHLFRGDLGTKVAEVTSSISPSHTAGARGFSRPRSNEVCGSWMAALLSSALGGEGVEAQGSGSVGRQADRYHVPRICFIRQNGPNWGWGCSELSQQFRAGAYQSVAVHDCPSVKGRRAGLTGFAASSI